MSSLCLPMDAPRARTFANSSPSASPFPVTRTVPRHCQFRSSRRRNASVAVVRCDLPGFATQLQEQTSAFLARVSEIPPPAALVSDLLGSLRDPSSSLEQLRTSAALLTTEFNNVITSGTASSSSLLSSASDSLSLALARILAQLSVLLGASPAASLSSDPVAIASFAGGSAVAGSAALLARKSSSPNDKKAPPGFVEGESLPLRYDPDAIAAFFRKRPQDIVARTLKIIFECSTFVTSLLADKSRGLLRENENLRASQLVGLIARLGPTAIKIGQALSIRPDILPKVYLDELQKLQDRVPPFLNEEALQIIVDSLGRPIEEMFSEISAEPIAAASLGQVYKARLKGSGQLVAVKVQRPGVLEGISRDLYLLRKAAYAAQSLPNMQSDFVALLDNWAYRFFDELDYVQEGRNGERFAKNMQSLPNIIVPKVYMEYTSRKVLTTEWVEGEKLSESKSKDLLVLVKTALNCYLMQLLESGFLHADPHPGNLLRTSDGSLCVLDYGLMTEVTEDQRYTFIEYISHLLNSDYARVAEDLVKLGFVPPELVDPEKTVSVVPQLTRVFGQLVQGGGARKVNIEQISQDLSNMAEDYVFVIPPYFALILRAFSVLEGIGLEADPDYTIMQDCYPYLSKRLITDDSPRARAALKYFLYAGKEQLDVDRMEDIMYGFQTYRELTLPPPSGVSGALPPSRPPVDPAAKEVLHLLFAPEGSYVQELLLAELVRAVDALSRDALAELWRYFALRVIIPLPPALYAPKSWPLPLPGFLWGSVPVATLSDEDQQSLETVKRLWQFVEPQLIQGSSTRDMVESARGVVRLFPELFPGVLTVVRRFIFMLMQRQALRLADDLDGKTSVTEWNKDPSAFARQLKPIKLPNLDRYRG